MTAWRAGMPSYHALSAAISSRVGNGSLARRAFTELRAVFMLATLPERDVYRDKKGYRDRSFSEWTRKRTVNDKQRSLGSRRFEDLGFQIKLQLPAAISTAVDCSVCLGFANSFERKVCRRPGLKHLALLSPTTSVRLTSSGSSGWSLPFSGAEFCVLRSTALRYVLTQVALFVAAQTGAHRAQ